MKSFVKVALLALLLTASTLAQISESDRANFTNCMRREMNYARYMMYCAECFPGYVVTGTYLNNCSACNTECNGCTTSVSNCKKCADGYFSAAATFPAPCSACSRGCKTCTTSLSCQACFDGNYMINSVGSQTCGSCISGCKTCSDATGCDSCSRLHIKIKENGVVKCILNSEADIWTKMIGWIQSIPEH